MGAVCLTCEGFQLGPLAVPPLEVRLGELVCLHLPYLPSKTEQKQLIRLLTGTRRSPAVHSEGRVVYLEPAAAEDGFLPHLFNRQTAVSWLCHTAGVSRGEARALARDVGVRGNASIDRLPATARNLLAVQAAWARQAKAVVFSTAGCDLDGVRATYDLVTSRLPQGAAIHLSYPYVIGFPGQVYQPVSPRLDRFAFQHPDYPYVRAERRCAREARCVELTEERVVSVRV